MTKYRQFREYSPENELPELLNGCSDGLERSSQIMCKVKDYGFAMAIYRSDGIWELYSPYPETSGEFETKNIECWLY